MEGDDMDMIETENKQVELDDMKIRLKEMEEEATALRQMHAKAGNEMASKLDPAAGGSSLANREEVDSRSVFVGNVDYSCTPEEVQQHFQSCGTVNRVTIRTDKFGQPKGYAYVEFLQSEAVQEALHLNESELHGRQLKVTVKRTNVPGMKQHRPRRPNPFMVYQSRGAIIPPFLYSPYGYGFPGSECQCVTAPTTEGSILLDAVLVVRRGCNHVKQYSLLILFMDMLSED
ncbi:polyadenylate-binding protein 2 [Citrus sinensis]|nr:polyadenylate-binding protein 2 [Citrus sinensis]